MRIAVLSDIHSNLEALEAVLADLGRQGAADQTWCLGDVVGYGPDPTTALEFVRTRADVAIAGNHDLAAAGALDTSDFNPDAAAAAHWTSQRLSEEQRRFLRELPTKAVASPSFTVAHGSPRAPVWEYLLSVAAAQANLEAFDTPYCLVGHSHVPLVFAFPEGAAAAAPPSVLPRLLRPGDPLPPIEARVLRAGEAVTLGAGRWIVNPGSVGQPRDGDPRASYAILDTEAATFTLRRVSYDFRLTQEKMRRAGLPVFLSERLALGR